MADKKISQLTSLAQGDIATTTDVLAIVDTSATETKKATPAAIVGAAAAAGLTSVDINSGAIDGTTIGANSAAAGTFTNLTASGTVSFSGATVSNGGSVTTVDINGGTIDGASVGASSASSGAFTTLSASGNVTLSGGTANGVLYLNGSKVATSGSALTFDGTQLKLTASSPASTTFVVASGSFGVRSGANSTNGALIEGVDNTGAASYQPLYIGGSDLRFTTSATEGMRLTSTGLGIGTSSPAYKLDVSGSVIRLNNSGATADIFLTDSGTTNGYVRLRGESNALKFITGNGVSATLDSSGNLGLGVTPGAWTLGSTMQVGYAGSLWYDSTSNLGNIRVSNNIRFNGALQYLQTGAASYYQQGAGAHYWFSYASGSAGANLSGGAGQAMTLDASGNLLVGGTTSVHNAAGRGNIEANGSSSATLGLTVGAATAGLLLHDGTNSYYRNYKNGYFAIWTNNSERARITSDGDLLINATTNTWSAKVYVEVDDVNASVMEATNASYAQAGFGVFGLNVVRAANSAYTFLGCYSGDGADREFELRGDGNGYADGTWNNNGADYAEYFESATGGALTVGATVVLEGNKVREATASDPVSAIIGVVRPKEPGKASMVVGNTAWNKWAHKYLTDDFDRYIMEDHDVMEWTDEDGKQHSYESHNIPDGVTVPVDAVRKTHDDKGNKFQHYKLNPAWDKDAEYTPREKRPEWNIIGLVGQVKVLKGKPVNDRWIKMRDVSAAVEEWMIR